MLDKPLHSLSYVSHPRIPVLSAGGVNFIHLRSHRGGGDKEHPSLLIGYFSNDELLQRDNRRLLVLKEEQNLKTKLEEKKRQKKQVSLIFKCLSG